MKNYKVKVIQMLLKNNKIAKSGDLVTEAQLNGNPAELEKKGFIATVSSKKEEETDAEKEAREAAEAGKAEKEAAEKEAFENAFEEGSLTADQLESITKSEIAKYAEKHELVFDENEKKADLITQVLKAEKVQK